MIYCIMKKEILRFCGYFSTGEREKFALYLLLSACDDSRITTTPNKPIRAQTAMAIAAATS